MKNPLSDLDHIHADNQLKQKTLSRIYRERKHHKASLPMICTALACMALIVWGIGKPWKDNSTIAIPSYAYESYISLDINPSMELRLDEHNVIVDSNAYNEEGSALLTQLQPNGLTLEDCLQHMMENDSFQQYMENGHLQISIYSDNEGRIKALREIMETTLSHHYAQDQFDCHYASNADHEQASQHHMSMGCYQMINKILAEDENYSFEELSELNIAQLRDIYRECRQSHRGHGHGYHHEEH